MENHAGRTILTPLLELLTFACGGNGESQPYKNVYWYGDFCSGRIWGLACDPTGKSSTRVLRDTDLRLSSFAEGHDGEVYALDYSGGGLYRVAPFSNSLSANGRNP